MKSHVSRPFLREVEQEFNKLYPYLRIEFLKKGIDLRMGVIDADEQIALREKAHNLLLDDAGLTEAMTVGQLESTLQTLFSLPVQIFRKSGRIWIETKMTRNWTLRQQNEFGRELAPGEEG